MTWIPPWENRLSVDPDIRCTLGTGRILLIDDSLDTTRLAETILRKEGLDFLSTDTGMAGLEMARQNSPDVILLDLDLPDMHGFDVCRRLRDAPNTSLIPVLYLTAEDNTASKVRGLDIGAIDYVTKPFHPLELLARVRVALRIKHLQDTLTREAHIDPLTGLWNRRALEDRLKQSWDEARRHDDTIVMILCDIDHFKSVNDTHGHAVGDLVLRNLASILRQTARSYDFCARYGGEEFIILLTREVSCDAVALAERCRGNVAAMKIEAGRELFQITASFGLADSSGCDTPNELLRAADAALYEAKRTGRNRVRVHAAAKFILPE